jgi:FkbM family methyltransferase
MYLLNPRTHFEKLEKEDTTLFFPDYQTAQWFYSTGIPERDLIMWTKETLISTDKVFLDIGAHVGTYSWSCGQKALHTYSFECNPRVFCYLAANIALHGLEEKVTPYSYALGNETKKIDYYIRSADGGGNGVKQLHADDDRHKKISVEMRTLDSFQFENVGCIKIDVEGFEKEVLMGGVETIRRCKPTLLFESWGQWKQDIPDTLQSELFEFVRSLGYTLTPVQNTQDMYLAYFPS